MATGVVTIAAANTRKLAAIVQSGLRLIFLA